MTDPPDGPDAPERSDASEVAGLVDGLVATLLAAESTPHQRGVAARALHKLGAGREAILARPDADVEVTVAVCDALEFEEAFAVVEPFWSTQRMRDAWTWSRYAGHPAMLDRVLSLVDSDPFGAMVLLGHNVDARMPDEVRVICERCSAYKASLVYNGLVVEHLSPRLRRTQRGHTWWGITRFPVPTARRALAYEALTTFRRRDIAVGDDVKETLLRLRPDPGRVP